MPDVRTVRLQENSSLDYQSGFANMVNALMHCMQAMPVHLGTETQQDSCCVHFGSESEDGAGGGGCDLAPLPGCCIRTGTVNRCQDSAPPLIEHITDYHDGHVMWATATNCGVGSGVAQHPSG